MLPLVSPAPGLASAGPSAKFWPQQVHNGLATNQRKRLRRTQATQTDNSVRRRCIGSSLGNAGAISVSAAWKCPTAGLNRPSQTARGLGRRWRRAFCRKGRQ
eukprot:scaffold2131_cov384-Prasinococcus_capsulatus_cf.AAC.13